MTRQPDAPTRRDTGTPADGVNRARPLLGTFVEITAGGLPQAGACAAIERAFRAVEQVQALMSYQSPDSEVSRLNRQAGDEPVAVSEPTWQVLAAAQRIAQASEGLFDITVAATLSRLGFLPRHAGCPRADGRAGWQHVKLLEGRRVQFTRKLRIDLSGIAKGYAVDLAIGALQDSGAAWGRVNAGGDLRLFGMQAQCIHVRYPADPALNLPVVEMRDGAVATSAGYYSRRRYQGRPVVPLIHPARRAASASHDSVTVMAADCMTADALTKVVHADAGRSLAILKHFKAEALVMRADQQDGSCRIYDTRAPAPRLAAAGV